MSAEAPDGKEHTIPVPRRHIAQQRPKEHAAAQMRTRTHPSIRLPTRSSYRHMPRHRCLPSKRRWDGSTGPGGQSPPRSGVTAQHGRMDICQARHIVLHLSAEIQCQTLPTQRKISERFICICFTFCCILRFISLFCIDTMDKD